MSLRGYKPKTRPAPWRAAAAGSVGSKLPSVSQQRREAVAASQLYRGPGFVTKDKSFASEANGNMRAARKRVRPVSDRQRLRNAEYERVKNAWWGTVTSGVVPCAGTVRGSVEHGDVNEVHHVRGRAGALLFDTRYWLPVCAECHRWIHDHPAAAQKLGLLAARGDWGRQ